MAQKWQTISELAAETSRKVTHSPEEWCRFLTTAARFYKAYDFDDQLLIYAQKPNATACADMPTWNNKMRRWVNAGSTAIALIRKGYGGKPYLSCLSVSICNTPRISCLPHLMSSGKYLATSVPRHLLPAGSPSA